MKQRYCYSAETFNLLNLWTLDIKDPEIKREYDLYRIRRVNSLCWPFVGCFLFLIVAGLIMYFFMGATLADAMQPMYKGLAVVAFLLPRIFCNRYSPQSIIFAQSVTLLYVNLAFRGYIPGQGEPEQMV